MDEARAVLERLERIDRLERDGTPPRELLEEVRALLAEAEAWVRAEPRGTSRAEEALERCNDALSKPFVTAGLC
jgi:hypothetical protein